MHPTPPDQPGEYDFRVAFETLPRELRRLGFETLRTNPLFFIFLRHAAERVLRRRRQEGEET
ncbi:MAG TPA: hypothetical protein VN667_17120 [Burkholderiales bacterium]|nr:hypothetical protein [Burkholderiales bacterium]